MHGVQMGHRLRETTQPAHDGMPVRHTDRLFPDDAKSAVPRLLNADTPDLCITDAARLTSCLVPHSPALT